MISMAKHTDFVAESKLSPKGALRIPGGGVRLIARRLTMMSWSTAIILSAGFLTVGAVAQEVLPAQENAVVQPETASAEDQAEYRKKRGEQLLLALDSTYKNNILVRDPGVKPEDVGSLVFTLWEQLMIEEWRNTQDINTRAPEQGEAVARAGSGPREIALSGIVWRSSGEWTVWLNGQRLKPDALPREVMDINVHKKYVELKWYDATTNLIYPVRLRPHQRFNLDSRMFLPGVTAAN